MDTTPGANVSVWITWIRAAFGSLRNSVWRPGVQQCVYMCTPVWWSSGVSAVCVCVWERDGVVRATVEFTGKPELSVSETQHSAWAVVVEVHRQHPVETPTHVDIVRGTRWKICNTPWSKRRRPAEVSPVACLSIYNDKYLRWFLRAVAQRYDVFFFFLHESSWLLLGTSPCLFQAEKQKRRGVSAKCLQRIELIV